MSSEGNGKNRTFAGRINNKAFILMKTMAIFASGEGTNAENLIKYFSSRDTVKAAVVIYNRKEAGVRLRAERLGIPSEYVPKAMLHDQDYMLPLLRRYGVDFIVLSGFLLLIPEYLLEAYPHRVINIHPSLLPRHGGKGMHGLNVHEDVLKSGDAETGITVHICDSDLDRGITLFQAKCPVERGDTPETLAARVHKLEYAFFPEVVERYAEGKYNYKIEK